MEGWKLAGTLFDFAGRENQRDFAETFVGQTILCTS